MVDNQATLNEQNEQKFQQWSQSEYVKISNYCSSKGYQIKKVDQPKSSVLPPIVAVWHVKTTENNLSLWVISGDFPTDLVDANIAQNARQSLRHFSMSWHMQAANLEEGIATGKIELQDAETQTKFAQQLTHRAEKLYEIYQDEALWAATGLQA